MVLETDRGPGILNNRQRSYLRGESDIEPHSPAERSIRQSIRNDLRNALLDFTILERHLEDRDREQVFDAFEVGQFGEQDPDGLVDQGTYPGDDQVYEVALGAVLAFLYRGVSGRTPTFEMLLQYAIPRAEHPDAAPLYPEYDVELTVTQLDPSPVDVRRGLRNVGNDNLQGMSDREVRAVLRWLRASRIVEIRELLREFEARLETLEEDGLDGTADEATLTAVLVATAEEMAESTDSRTESS